MAGREKNYKIMEMTNGTKNVAFIGVMHLNKPQYFARVKHDIDSLRNAGFTIMYEGVSIDTKDSVAEDLIRRKFRRVTGFHLSKYLDTTNVFADTFKVDGVVEQSPLNTGIRFDEDICADYSMDSLVIKYEQARGPIILSKCDYQTRLGDKYKCAKVDRQNILFMIETLRDTKLVNEIVRHPNNKIAVLFGAGHRQVLYANLKKHDSTYTMAHLYKGSSSN